MYNFCPWTEMGWLSQVGLYFKKSSAFGQTYFWSLRNCRQMKSVWRTKSTKHRKLVNFLIPFLSSRESQRFVTQSVIIYVFIFPSNSGDFFPFKDKQFYLRIFFSIARCGRVMCYCSHQVELLTYVINVKYVPLVNLKELCRNPSSDRRSSIRSSLVRILPESSIMQNIK